MLDDVSFLSRLRSWCFGGAIRSAPGALIPAAVAFLLVAGIGAVTCYVGHSYKAAGLEETNSFSPSGLGSNGELLARLIDYTRSIETEQPASMAAADEPLPEVNTMIERLAARLETTPEDIEGWRMLGWSHFHTARYEQAANAFARAVELDPNSDRKSVV